MYVCECVCVCVCVCVSVCAFVCIPVQQPVASSEALRVMNISVLEDLVVFGGKGTDTAGFVLLFNAGL